MYNANIKERFLDSLNITEGSKRNYRYILEKAALTESNNTINKDVYSFTPYECDQLILSFPRKSVEIVAVIISCFKQYINFCKSINLIQQDEFNYFETLSGRNDLLRFVDKVTADKKYITFEELQDIQNFCENEQDVAQLELIFIGLSIQESRDLLVENIKPDRIILQDREIPISARTHGILESAVCQTEYAKNNGGDVVRASSEMVINTNNPYVLRPSGSTKFGKLSYTTYAARFNRIKHYVGEKSLILTHIRFSGQVYLAKQIKEEKSELIFNDWKYINDIFGIKARPHYLKAKVQEYL